MQAPVDINSENLPLLYGDFLCSKQISKIIYLDRDGVLLKPVIRGGEVSSARKSDEVEIYDDVLNFGKNAKIYGFTLVVISNQPDISRGISDLQFLEKTNQKINEVIPIDYYIYCPHQAAVMCRCRKPESGMIKLFRSFLARDVNEVFIGDRQVDYECAKAVGIKFILRKQKYNQSNNSIFNLHKIPTIDNLDEIWNFLGV